MGGVRHRFDEQLDQLEQRLLEMGAFVESMLDKAMRSLYEQDEELAREVIAADDVADDMDLEIERRCMRLLALQQPMAADLRTIGTIMKVIADVERIGDFSVDIAKIAIDLPQTDYLDRVELQKMEQMVRDLVQQALRALVNRDLNLVQRVIAGDDNVDKMWYGLFDKLVATMEEHPHGIGQGASLLLVARYLERIADHTVNIAERVAYMETGEMETLAPSHRAEYQPDDDDQIED